MSRPFNCGGFDSFSAWCVNFPHKKARSLCELRAIISSILWGSHGGCARSVLDQALLSQEIGEGFEFGIPCFAETADEGLA